MRMIRQCGIQGYSIHLIESIWADPKHSDINIQKI